MDLFTRIFSLRGLHVHRARDAKSGRASHSTKAASANVFSHHASFGLGATGRTHNTSKHAPRRPPHLRPRRLADESCLSQFGSQDRRFTGRLRTRPMVPPSRAARGTPRRRHCRARRRHSGVHVLREEIGGPQAGPTSGRCPSCTRQDTADLRDGIAHCAFTDGALDTTHRGLHTHCTGGHHGQEEQAAGAPRPARITVAEREARGARRAAAPHSKDDLHTPPPYPTEGSRGRRVALHVSRARPK